MSLRRGGLSSVVVLRQIEIALELAVPRPYRKHQPFIIVIGLPNERQSLEPVMIHVIATIRTYAGRRDDLLAAFRQLVPQVRQEAGCLEYGPAIDLKTPVSSEPTARPDVVTVIEKWESVKALQDHLAAPHMLKYRETVKDIVAEVEIRAFQPA